jgi:hypothetical protein
MRWVTYVSPRDGRERAGLLRDGAIHGVRALHPYDHHEPA